MATIRLTEQQAKRMRPASDAPAKAKRKTPVQWEAFEQKQVVGWARNKFLAQPDKFPDLDLLFCSLAGIHMTKPQAARAKEQGNREGVLDLILPKPLRGYCGLFIEMKRKKGGTVSGAQRAEVDRLVRLGYKAVVCEGHEEGIRAIYEYYFGPGSH